MSGDTGCQIVRTPAELSAECRRISLALGAFDGVHIGHQAILRAVQSDAQRLGAEPVVLFFNPPPRAIFQPDVPFRCLTSLAQKLELFAKNGIRRAVVFPFDLELAQLTSDEFFYKYLVIKELDIVSFCVGRNWTFGCGGKAGGEELRRLATPLGMETRLVESVSLHGFAVSSTRIRAAVEAGRMDVVTEMLGRPYFVDGEVCHGLGVGRKMGVPTANVVEQSQMLPKYGVYAARGIVDGVAIDGIVYVGDAPTIRQTGDPQIIVELHLFDFSNDIYGKKIRIEFHHYIRPSMRFTGQEALMAQIAKDVEEAKRALKN